MNRQEILAIASKDPSFQQGADILEARLSQMRVTPEMLQELVATLEYVMSNPNKYPEVRQMAIVKGFAKDPDIPSKFQLEFVMALLLALYAMQDRLKQGSKAFAQGGLAQYGRGGDTMLAHINPMEAEVLRRMGGSGTTNPNTGIIEFKGGGVGKLLSVVAPIALNFFVPGAGLLLHAAVGAGAAALGGGNPITGALFGGLGAGLGSVAGSAAKGMLGEFGAGMSAGASNAMGNALVGGLAGAATGQGVLQGAARGVAGGMLGDATAGMGAGMSAAGKATSNLFATGASPQQALIGGGLAGLAQGLSDKYQRPSDIVASGMGLKAATPLNASTNPVDILPSAGYGLTTPGSSAGAIELGLGSGLRVPSTLSLAEMGGGQGIQAPQSGLEALATTAKGPSFSMPTAQMLALAPTALALLGSAQTPQQVQQATSAMSPEQRAFFEKTAPAWDWGKIQREASAAGQGLGTYVAENWDKFTPGNQFEQATPPVKKLAQGGLGMLMTGGGSGRDDTIDARLSDGEYVFDAETTALLGDGSVKEGARRLDMLRAQVRKHKGAALVKGKISPNAKSPLAYLKEVA